MRFILVSLLIWAFPIFGVSHAQSLVRDAEIEAVLRQWSDPILEAAGLQPGDIELYIVNDRSLNAFVAGGQNIFFNTGFLMAADDVSQILAVIGHETCHIACGHTVTRAMAARAASGPALISIGLGILAAAAGAADAGIALIASAPTFGARSFFTYTRAEEAMADQKGIEYLAKAGYSPEGMIGFFEKFRSQEVLTAESRDPYFRSHPLASDRIRFARLTAERTGLIGTPIPEAMTVQFEMMQAKLVGYFEPMSRVLRHYPPEDTSQAARYARAHASFKIADMTAALRMADGLIAESPDNPYFHELRGFILFENGRGSEAVQSNRRAVALSPHSALLKVNLARSLAERGEKGDLEEASAILVAALAIEDDNSFAWHELSRLYERLGQRALAEHATAESRYHVGDYQQANRFARRALDGLEKSSIAYIRASDIVAVSRIRIEQSRQRG